MAGLTAKSPTTVGSTARPDISTNERGSAAVGPDSAAVGPDAAAVGPDAAAGNPDAGQPSQRIPKANTPDETAAQATRMTPTKPVNRQANKRIDAISNNLMTRQVNQRATQIQNAGLIESNQRLAAYKSTAFHSEIVKLMTYAAAHTLMKRRDHWRVVQAPEWKLLLKRVRRDLSQYRTKSKRANVRLNDIMMAVLHMLDKDDPYERASAYALVDHIFSALGERLPQTFGQM